MPSKSIVIDQGNTRLKYGVFEGQKLLISGEFENSELNALSEIIEEHRITKGIYACSGTDEFEKHQEIIPGLIQASYNLKLPFKIDYKTPQTLGIDRIANSAYAAVKHLGEDCLIIDFGTCITYDFVSANSVYNGGFISPGLNSRLKAMHEHTSRLPLIEEEHKEVYPGKSTVESMYSGVFYGIVGEINEIISRFDGEEKSLRILLCGGDFKHFEKALKYSTFADLNLTLKGLNEILLQQ